MNVFEEQKRLNKELGVELSNYWSYVVSRKITMITPMGKFDAPEGVNLIFIDLDGKVRGVGIVENDGRLSTTPIYQYKTDKFPLTIRVYLMGFEWKTLGISGYGSPSEVSTMVFPSMYQRFILNSLEVM